MQNRVVYEWTTEQTDSDGDIVDSCFYTSLNEISHDCFSSNTIGLVRNEGNEINGLGDRYWAYIKDGELPEYFSDGADNSVGFKVPKKFQNELSAYLKHQTV